MSEEKNTFFEKKLKFRTSVKKLSESLKENNYNKNLEKYSKQIFSIKDKKINFLKINSSKQNFSSKKIEKFINSLNTNVKFLNKNFQEFYVYKKLNTLLKNKDNKKVENTSKKKENFTNINFYKNFRKKTKYSQLLKKSNSVKFNPKLTTCNNFYKIIKKKNFFKINKKKTNFEFLIVIYDPKNSDKIKLCLFQNQEKITKKNLFELISKIQIKLELSMNYEFIYNEEGKKIKKDNKMIRKFSLVDFYNKKNHEDNKNLFLKNFVDFEKLAKKKKNVFILSCKEKRNIFEININEFFLEKFKISFFVIKKLFIVSSVSYKKRLNYKSSKLKFLANEKLEKYFNKYSLDAVQYKKILKNFKGILNEKKKLNFLKTSLKSKNKNLNNRNNLYKEYISQKKNFWKVSKKLKINQITKLRKKCNFFRIKNNFSKSNKQKILKNFSPNKKENSVNKNITKNYLEKNNFSREEYIKIKIIYKTMQNIQKNINKQKKILNLKILNNKKIKTKGITFPVFYNFLYEIMNLGKHKAELLFQQLNKDKSGFLKWNEFVNAMKLINHRNIKNKLNIFSKIADQDNNGFLSYDEIFELAHITLKSNFFYSSLNFDEDFFFEDMTHYFTNLVFKICDTDINSEIAIEKIKDVIIKKEDNYLILLFFCGVD